MTITFEEVEIELECGEIFYADIKITATGDGYKWEASLAESTHPFLAKLKDPRIQAELDKAVCKLVANNHSKIQKQFDAEAIARA